MNDQNRLMARYQQLRQVGKRVTSDLIKHLAKGDMNAGGEKLGILKRGILVFDDENEMAVLMDFCIHELRRDGLTAIDRLLAAAP
jgi:hypothetical protein